MARAADAERSLALASYFAEDRLSRAPSAVASITTAAQALQDAGGALVGLRAATRRWLGFT